MATNRRRYLVIRGCAVRNTAGRVSEEKTLRLRPKPSFRNYSAFRAKTNGSTNQSGIPDPRIIRELTAGIPTVPPE